MERFKNKTLDLVKNTVMIPRSLGHTARAQTHILMYRQMIIGRSVSVRICGYSKKLIKDLILGTYSRFVHLTLKNIFNYLRNLKKKFFYFLPINSQNMKFKNIFIHSPYA